MSACGWKFLGPHQPGCGVQSGVERSVRRISRMKGLRTERQEGVPEGQGVSAVEESAKAT